VVPVTKAWFYGWAGSLKLGLYDKGQEIIYVGDLSGITEEQKENWKQLVSAVVEISCMEITTNQNGGWGFRHPRMLRIRDDKPARECTVDQIK
jgi:ATP-dependent DNA ligase